MTKQKESFGGNPNLRPAGVRIGLTREQMREYVKCANDPVYFATNYMYIINADTGKMKFQMWDFQKRFLTHIKDNRFVIAKLSRQVGKCVTFDTQITLKHEKYTNNKPITIPIGIFFEWLRFRENINKNKDLQQMLEC